MLTKGRGKNISTRISIDEFLMRPIAFSMKVKSVTDPDLKATINYNALSTVDTTTYLGVTFGKNAKSAHHV